MRWKLVWTASPLVFRLDLLAALSYGPSFAAIVSVEVLSLLAVYEFDVDAKTSFCLLTPGAQCASIALDDAPSPKSPLVPAGICFVISTPIKRIQRVSDFVCRVHHANGTCFHHVHIVVRPIFRQLHTRNNCLGEINRFGLCVS